MGIANAIRHAKSFVCIVLAAGAMSCADLRAESMEGNGKDPQANLRPLSVGERKALQDGLDLAAKLAKAPRPLPLAQVQQIYNRLLAEGIGDGDESIAVGLAFGETLLNGGKYEWARVEDAYGEETCIAAVDRILYAAPISMIQKRLQRRERVDLVEMRLGILEMMAEQAATSRERPR